MAEWLVEQGIGEHRAILLDHGRILAARIVWPGTLIAGQVHEAQLIAKNAGAERGTVRLANGDTALIDRLPRQITVGMPLRVKVTRTPIAEHGRQKLAHVIPTTQSARPALSLAQTLGARIVSAFPACDWDELIAEAWDSIVEFPGGSLTFSPTPAMMLVDIDGFLAPHALAMAAIPALQQSIHRFGLSGSIGVDFPTLDKKADRKAIDHALASALDNWPHERTAMNGFGFVQLVSRKEASSLIERIACSPAEAAARALLRRAEHVEEAGRLLITTHTDVLNAITPDWRDMLVRRTGRSLIWQNDDSLALNGGFAQAVEP